MLCVSFWDFTISKMFSLTTLSEQGFKSLLSPPFALCSLEHSSKPSNFLFTYVFIFCYLSSPILIPTLGEQESCSLLYPPTLKIMPNIRGLFLNNVKWISVLMMLLCGPKLSGSQNEERRILLHACLAQDPIRCVLTDAVSKAPYIPTVNLGTEALQLLLKVSSIKIKNNVKGIIVK